MKILLTAFFLLIISAGSSAAQTQEWIMIWDDEPSSTYYFYDPSTIKISGSHLDVDLKITPYDDVLAEGKAVDYTINNVRFYCKENAYRSNKSTIFFTDSTKKENGKTKKEKLSSASPLQIFYRLLCSE
jgi:hypothetical protein